MIPLFSSTQVREADSYAINTLGIPSIILMENAARNIFDIIVNRKKVDNRRIGIICGKGNNGGDGFALARHFINNSFDVFIVSLGAEEELKGDALINFRICQNLLNDYPKSQLIIFQSIKDISTIEDCSIIIDAMLGTGSRGGLSDPYKDIVEKLNLIPAYRVAIDLPSGLDLTNSTGDVIFNADLTITLSEYKTGLFYGKGYVNTGEVVKGYIGIGTEYYEKLPVNEYLIEPEDAFLGIPVKELDAHKYSSGKVLIIAGSAKLPGAAILTTNTTLKSGAGAAILTFPQSVSMVAQQKLDSAIVFSYNDNNNAYLDIINVEELKERIDWADAIAIGPGLGREEATVSAVLEIIRTNKNKKFIIDADAIFALGNGEYQNVNLKNKILTPHQKEFSDMLGIGLAELKNDIINYGRNFSKEYACFLVLKGAPTIIFNPAGEVFINSLGNPGMAKFGTGDVLTGIIASFISQSEEFENTLISAIYLHSLAADLIAEEKSEYGYTATDIMEKIPHAIKFILNSFL